MNDDELGRALGTALTPPEVVPAADAGVRLRARARRARTERLAVGGTLVVALAVLIAVGVLRGTGGGTAPTQIAASPTGYSRLTTPLTIALAKIVPLPPGTCHVGPGLRCVPPATALTVDEVAGVTVSELPERGAIVRVVLVPADARTLADIGVSALTAGVGALSYPATTAGGALRIRVESPEAADGVVAALGLVDPGPARTGPGRLDVPLQLWSVTRNSAPPCRISAASPGVIVQNLGPCVVATGPQVSIAAADLEIVAPGAGAGTGDARWRVSVGVDPADRPGLAAFVQTGKQIALAAGGRLLSATVPSLTAVTFSTGFEVTVDGRAGAEALISRLRP